MYKEAVASPRCGVIHFTEIQADLECDTFFPAIDPARWAVVCACCPLDFARWAASMLFLWVDIVCTSLHVVPLQGGLLVCCRAL